MRLTIIFLAFIMLFANSYELAKNHAEIYKKALPFRTTDNLILTDILAVGDSLIYRYSVNETMKNPVLRFSDDELEDYKKTLTKIALKNSCKDKIVLNLLHNGIVIEHLFYFELSKLLFEVHMNRQKCNEIGL